MRKLFYTAFCVVLAMGVGCALTDYGIITDNDQVTNASGGGPATVNTNGKAHVRETSQWAWTFGGGAGGEEWIDFVDQNSNGDQVISTYINGTLPGVGGGQVGNNSGPVFHDDEYCNPDWNGCAVWTAQNPVVGDVSVFDGTYNPACHLIGSLSVLVSSPVRGTECGRGDGMFNSDLNDMFKRAQMVMMGTAGQLNGNNGIFFDFAPQNFSMTVDGNYVSLPSFQAHMDTLGRWEFDVTNFRFGQVFRRAAQFMPVGSTPDVRISYNGLLLYNPNVKMAGDIRDLGIQFF